MMVSFFYIDQWSDYYHDEDETTLIHETYKYYFPDQFNEAYRYTFHYSNLFTPGVNYGDFN